MLGRKPINLKLSSHCEEQNDEAIPCLLKRLLRQKTPRDDWQIANHVFFAKALIA